MYIYGTFFDTKSYCYKRNNLAENFQIMNYPKILIYSTILIFSFSAVSFAQNIQAPSLSAQRTVKTLIIDSIPTTTLKNYGLQGIKSVSNDYRLFMELPISSYPTFGISRARPHMPFIQNAFTHKSLLDPVVYDNWNNPYGIDSFGQGVIIGSVQILTDLFKK